MEKSEPRFFRHAHACGEKKERTCVLFYILRTSNPAFQCTVLCLIRHVVCEKCRWIVDVCVEGSGLMMSCFT